MFRAPSHSHPQKVILIGFTSPILEATEACKYGQNVVFKINWQQVFFFPASELRYLSFWYGILIPMALFLGFTLFRLVIIIADTHWVV